MKRLRFPAILLALATLFSVPPVRAYDSLTYLYGSSTSVYLSRMAKTCDSVNIVSPDYFETTASGAVIFTKTPDPLLISMMHTNGVTVTPFVSNHWNRAQGRAMLKNPSAAVTFLVNAVKTYGLDGLDIDIQNINHDDRADFTAFIAMLRNALPTGKTLTVCVAANPYRTNVGWQGGYDYGALAQYCDHVFMMTYDESYEGSSAGPVCSMWFIEESVKYGLEHVPKEKLMLGIPFYGRYWARSTNKKDGFAWTIADIEWLIAATNATVTYDEQKACARATIVVPQGSNLKTWGGSSISPDTYDVWFDNAQSFEQKLALVRKYDIKGVGTWALGQEPSYMWENFSAWLNGLPFNDIKNHWAQSYIINLAAENLITGRTATTFAPDGTLTRAEAATLLCRIANLAPQNGTAAFTDTGSHWANGYIAAAKSAELISGFSNGTFLPDAPVTREQFAVMAERYTSMSDAVNLIDSPFSDVSKSLNPWSNDAILILAASGVLSGYNDGTFRPHNTITRGETAKLVTVLRTLPTRFVDGQILPSDDDAPHMEPR
ncbi:MAG: S-layer homology domain-containing protein [Oscillospiraceae bacterium]|jgi:spore germination protein YaaH|nr:S-layer homology domain-containing protein [Oscillospiraceae bacterium]